MTTHHDRPSLTNYFFLVVVDSGEWSETDE